MPYVVSLTLKAYQVTVPSSAAASSRPCLQEGAELVALSGLGLEHGEDAECYRHGDAPSLGS